MSDVPPEFDEDVAPILYLRLRQIERLRAQVRVLLSLIPEEVEPTELW